MGIVEPTAGTITLETDDGRTIDLVGRVIAKLRELKTERSLTVPMAEQNLNQAIRIADRGCIIMHEDIGFAAASAAELAENEMVKQYCLEV